MTVLLDIQTPRVFQPLLQPARNKGAYGGRGSGKSHFFGEAVIERHLLTPGTRTVCIREVQKSLEQSSKRLIEDKIQSLGVGHLFEVQDKVIKTPGGGLIIFQGMQNHTAESIKSLEGYDIAWVDEAQALSAHSLRLLRPTIRKPGSELWFSWNPSSPEDPVDDLLRGPNKVKNAIVVEANWRDNPWFPAVLEQERLADLERDPDMYHHVWGGHYITISDALIFAKRVVVDTFPDPPPGTHFYHGLDFGFARDPTALVRCWRRPWPDGSTNEDLMIDREAYAVGVELNDMAVFLDQVETARAHRREEPSWPIKADSSRPETISYLAKQGFNVSAAEKWPGSVEDGIAYLKGFQRIIIHPTHCPNAVREFRLYSYKTDKKDENVLPIVLEKHDHVPDAVRYALDTYITRGGPHAIGNWKKLADRTRQFYLPK